MKRENTSIEKWKFVDGYNNMYQISNSGMLWSLHNKGMFLKKRICKGGYLSYSLLKNGKANTCLINRLVAIAFIPNPNNLPCVNHIDEIKSNNYDSNLEWCTHLYNNNYGTRGVRIAKSLNVNVDKYDMDLNLICSYNSIDNAGVENNIFASAISQCCTNRRYSAGGFIWAYKDSIPREKPNSPIGIEIYQFTKQGVFIKKWNSSMEIERELKIGNSNVIQCCKGKFKTMGGYKWEYADIGSV
jgi:hypothetical protein